MESYGTYQVTLIEKARTQMTFSETLSDPPSDRRADSGAFAGGIAGFFAYKHPRTHEFFDFASIQHREDFGVAIAERLESSAI
jgi:hypothetical protein